MPEFDATITESCTHCKTILPQGRLARIWENRWFCNSLDQGSWMLTKGKALQKPAPKEYTSEYGYCIFKGQRMITYKRGIFDETHLFTDTDEFFRYVEEHLGHCEVVGEQIAAL